MRCPRCTSQGTDRTTLILCGNQATSSIPCFTCSVCRKTFKSPAFKSFQEEIRLTNVGAYTELLKRVGSECDNLVPVLMHESYNREAGDIDDTVR